jgi:hypothetical protein
MATSKSKPKTRVEHAKRHRVPADVFDARDFVYAPRPSPLKPRTQPPDAPVLDQGQEPACTGFALATVIHSQLAARGDSVHVSPYFLYENAKRYDEWRGEAYEGSSIRGAMKGFCTYGACGLKAMSSPLAKGQRRLPQTAYESGAVRPLGAYYRVVTSQIYALQAAILEAGAVLVSCNVHDGWNTPRKTAHLPQIHWDGKTYEDSGHAFALVGFDERGFIVQNSWGPGWGARGLARLTYEDWLANRQDAWIAQVGVGTVSLLHGPVETKTTSSGRRVARVRESDIQGHYLSIRHGVLDESGSFPSADSDLVVMARDVDTFRVARKLKRVPLMLYAHGGLVSEDAAAEKAFDFVDVMRDNGMYDVHLIWRTGFWDELSTLVSGRGPSREGAVGEWLSDQADLAIEAASRGLGSALWHLMRNDAAMAVLGPNLQGGGPLAAFLQTLMKMKIPFDLHLLGHSAGSILHTHALAWCAANGIEVKTLAYFAPAVSATTFTNVAMPLLDKPAAPAFRMWTMADRDEREDACAHVYHKSLLYFVSRAFEEHVDAPLLGLARNIALDYRGKDSLRIPTLADWLERNQRVRFVRPALHDVSLHSSFDDDEGIVNGWLKWALGCEPVRPYVFKRR